MSLTLLQNVNFGRNSANITGSAGVGYTLFDATGIAISSRITSGVYQLMSGSGIYAANVVYPDNFNGQILWDCPAITGTFGVISQSFAIEEQNVQANDPKVADTWNMVTQMSGTIGQLYDVQFGRWKIALNQMIFYKDDNVTEVLRFNLYNDAGVPSTNEVFERVKV